MSSDPLRMALLLPRISVPSGGVEVTLKVIEYAHTANVHYTAFLSKGNILTPEVRDRLEELAREGNLEIRSLADGNVPLAQGYDGIVVSSEFWIPALNKASRAGLRAPVFLKFHQLPYVGTLDVLKAVGVDNPTPVDLIRFPFVASRILRAPVPFFAFQVGACAWSVRALARRREAKVMAVTPVTSRNLRAFGYRGPLFVPRVHVGMEAERFHVAGAQDTPIEYDGVYVGRFHPHKGFLDLPLLVACLKRRLRRPLRIAVCGSPQFARHLRMFEDLVRSLGVGENLIMLRYLSQKELYATISRSRALLYPSYVDAFSITVLESLCLGVPVVAYRIDALRMLWGDRQGVFLSRVGDPGRLADLYAEIEGDGRLDSARAVMRAQSRKLLDEYTWPRAVAYEREFYDGRWAEDAAGG